DSTADSCEVNERGGAAEGGGAVPIVNLKRNWDTAFGVRAGGSYWPEENVEVLAGIGYDSNAVPDETLEPALTDFHDVSFALGGRFTPTDWLAFAVTYTHFIYFSR